MSSTEIEHIRQAMARPLPGVAAMLAMVPSDRRANLERFLNPPPCRHAAALLLLYPHCGQLHMPLTRRTESVETHKGQISLPGGAQEDGESLPEAALREAHEEVGVNPVHIQLMGALSPVYIPPSNFCLHPFVGYVAQRPEFCAFAPEVAELIETPLSVLLDPAARREEEWPASPPNSSPTRRVPFYQVGAHKVWGATAMILAEFIAIVAP